MASKESPKAKECPYSEKDAESVGRFVYDMLVYTLPKWGLSKSRIPSTDCKNNDVKYIRLANIIGLHAFGISLVLRDRLKQVFISRTKKVEFNVNDNMGFFSNLLKCFAMPVETSTKIKVIRTLAVCNEFILFFYTEGISFDINVVIAVFGYLILCETGFNPNFLEALEELFEVTDAIFLCMYFGWIFDFIEKFDFPYRYKNNVSDVFIEQFIKLIAVYLKIDAFQDNRTIEEVKQVLGFLPNDFASVEPMNLPKDVDSESRSILKDRVELPDLQTSIENSVFDVGEKMKRMGRHRAYVRVSEQTAQKDQTSKSTSEFGIEDDLRQMSLGASQKSRGAIPKRR